MSEEPNSLPVVSQGELFHVTIGGYMTIREEYFLEATKEVDINQAVNDYLGPEADEEAFDGSEFVSFLVESGLFKHSGYVRLHVEDFDDGSSHLKMQRMSDEMSKERTH